MRSPACATTAFRGSCCSTYGSRELPRPGWIGCRTPFARLGPPGIGFLSVKWPASPRFVENRDSAPGFSTFVALTPRFVEDRRAGCAIFHVLRGGARGRAEHGRAGNQLPNA